LGNQLVGVMRFLLPAALVAALAMVTGCDMNAHPVHAPNPPSAQDSQPIGAPVYITPPGYDYRADMAARAAQANQQAAERMLQTQLLLSQLSVPSSPPRSPGGAFFYDRRPSGPRSVGPVSGGLVVPWRA
jgi:hypothetical protein